MENKTPSQDFQHFAKRNIQSRVTEVVPAGHSSDDSNIRLLAVQSNVKTTTTTRIVRPPQTFARNEFNFHTKPPNALQPKKFFITYSISFHNLAKLVEALPE
jgi:hypothetical protein